MQPKRILIGDDDSELLPVLALHLRNEEYDVLCVRDGNLALEIARRERPDLLLLSVTLPAGEGQTVLDAIIGFPDLAGIPMLFLVSERNAAMRARGPAIPPSAAIRKPVSTRELISKVALCLAA